MDLDQLFAKFESPAQKDLKLNFKKFFQESNLSAKEAGLVALACATTTNCNPLSEFCEKFLKDNEASDEEIQEAKDAAAVMGVANVYYRFRHFIEKDAYKKPAGFRMSMMAKPVTGKLNFEMMALAVSMINACETCVQGHEKSVLEHGGTEEQIHDIARLAATVNGLEASFRSV